VHCLTAWEFSRHEFGPEDVTSCLPVLIQDGIIPPHDLANADRGRAR
jgi:hypothetical protein